jgi:hypothetical protein
LDPAKESKMTIRPAQSDQSDAQDKPAAVDEDGDAATAAASHKKLEQEEEEAARLGDFA